MATFDSIPLENLTRILELAGEHDLDDLDELDEFSAYAEWAAQATLAAASLVCRGWCEPAQALMWRSLDITKPRMATHIAASPIYGKYRTTRVMLRGDCFDEDETIEGVLGGLKGIETLELADSDEETQTHGVGWFALTSLRDLRTLILDTQLSIDRADNLLPSFRLRNLTLGGYTTADVNRILLASSLLSLTITSVAEGFEHALIPSLPLIANSLPSLILHGPVPWLVPRLSSFTALTSLSLHVYQPGNLPKFEALLAALPRPIDSIKVVIHGTHEQFLRTLTQTLRGAAGRKVTEVELWDWKLEQQVSPVGKEFSDVCAERGIGTRYNYHWVREGEMIEHV